MHPVLKLALLVDKLHISHVNKKAYKKKPAKQQPGRARFAIAPAFLQLTHGVRLRKRLNCVTFLCEHNASRVTNSTLTSRRCATRGGTFQPVDVWKARCVLLELRCVRDESRPPCWLTSDTFSVVAPPEIFGKTQCRRYNSRQTGHPSARLR